jgi:hypothetical protein
MSNACDGLFHLTRIYLRDKAPGLDTAVEERMAVDPQKVAQTLKCAIHAKPGNESTKQRLMKDALSSSSIVRRSGEDMGDLPSLSRPESNHIIPLMQAVNFLL